MVRHQPYESRVADFRRPQHLGLHLCQLLHTTTKIRIAAEPGVEKCRDYVVDDRCADDPGSEARHDDVIVLYRLASDVRVMDDGGPNPGNFVRGDCGSDAGATNQDAAICLIRDDQARHSARDDGEVNRRCVRRADVDDFMAQRLNPGDDGDLQSEACVVIGDRDLHGVRSDRPRHTPLTR